MLFISYLQSIRCILALDEVSDPMNLGAILRSSYFLGCNEIVLCSKNSAPLSPVVSKASAGALEAMTIYSVRNMMRFLDECKDNGWQVVGTSLSDKSIDLKDLTLDKPTVLVLGNEGHGIRTNILNRCDILVKLDGSQASQSENIVDSLNVSVTAGILLYNIIHNKK